MSSVEQQARDLLDRMEVEGAQNFSSGELVELANLISERNRAVAEVERLRERQESHDLANEAIRQKKRANDAAAELCRLRAQETRIREIAEYWRWINRDQPGTSPVLRQAGMQILAALDTEEGQA